MQASSEVDFVKSSSDAASDFKAVSGSKAAGCIQQSFSDALKEYLARHASDKITEAMDQARREIAGKKEPLVSSAARRVLEKSEW